MRRVLEANRVTRDARRPRGTSNHSEISAGRSSERRQRTPRPRAAAATSGSPRRSDETRRRRGVDRRIEGFTLARPLASFPRGHPHPDPIERERFRLFDQSPRHRRVQFPHVGSRGVRQPAARPDRTPSASAGSSGTSPNSSTTLSSAVLRTPLFPNTYDAHLPGPEKYAMFSTNPRMGALTLAYMSTPLRASARAIPAGWRR